MNTKMLIHRWWFYCMISVGASFGLAGVIMRACRGEFDVLPTIATAYLYIFAFVEFRRTIRLYGSEA